MVALSIVLPCRLNVLVVVVVVVVIVASVLVVRLQDFFMPASLRCHDSSAPRAAYLLPESLAQQAGALEFEWNAMNGTGGIKWTTTWKVT